jgi:AcrR family transcriptional regulator
MVRKRLTRQESQSRTRERLLEAAARLLARRGFDKASVDEIAAAAGYTKGAFYANFGSKEDLLLALMERHAAAARAERTEVLRSTGDADAALARLKQHVLAHAHEWEWLITGLEFKLTAARTPKLRAGLAAMRRAVIAAATGDAPIAPMIDNPLLRDDPEAFGTLFEVVLEGLALLHTIDDGLSEARLDAALEFFVDRMLSPARPSRRRS